MVRMWRVALGVALTLALFAGSAQAARIPLVTATTNMGAGFGTNLLNTVNGVGLSALTLNAIHNPSAPNNSWVSALGVLIGEVTFDLQGLYTVSGFSFWNQNAGGPGLLGSTGINGVAVSYSTNGVVFVPLPGAPASFARVMTGPSPPQIFAFAPIDATHIRFQILSNWGDPSQTGFAEVGFDGVASAIPEPATGLLLLAGLYGVRHRMRRRG